MKCWICNNEASSGEHLTKASDLRSLFGHVSQKSPLFLHVRGNLNQKIPGIKSDRLKSKALLCNHCNNAKTQPHDRAWEALSKYLRTRSPPIRPGNLIRLSPVFPGQIHRSMLNVHLYFLKLFGCLIKENSIPLDIGAFASAIREETAHPYVYLAFEAITDRRHHKLAGRTPVSTAQLNGRVMHAVWLYDVGPISVHVMYCEPTERRKSIAHSWHPDQPTKFLRIIDNRT